MKVCFWEFTMYFLCPGNEEEGWHDKALAELVSLFDADQRAIIREFLRSIAENVALRSWRSCAEHGLKWW